MKKLLLSLCLCCIFLLGAESGHAAVAGHSGGSSDSGSSSSSSDPIYKEVKIPKIVINGADGNAIVSQGGSSSSSTSSGGGGHSTPL